MSCRVVLCVCFFLFAFYASILRLSVRCLTCRVVCFFVFVCSVLAHPPRISFAAFETTTQTKPGGSELTALLIAPVRVFGHCVE